MCVYCTQKFIVLQSSIHVDALGKDLQSLNTVLHCSVNVYINIKLAGVEIFRGKVAKK